jgi:leucyl-tRNA synthetase
VRNKGVSLFLAVFFLIMGLVVSEYDPKAIEPKWQAFWEQNKTFKTDNSGRPKVYVLDMFPYPSGAGLHIGHPLGYTATDIYSRFKRMQGFDVLHPMGFDAFGLPAEQHAVNTGEHPAIITEKNCSNFVRQMKEIGFSYDWDREIATCRPEYYKWTQWIFLRLYNSWFDVEAQKARPIEELPIPSDIKAQGELAVQAYQAEHRLAYYAEAMVNWCPALGTVLANEEVIDGKSERGSHDVIRKPMKQWMLRITKYSERLISELDEIDWPEAIKEQQRNWIGKKTGTEITFSVVGSNKPLVAFTTRPDTLFGVTFFVVAPEHAIVDEITTAEQREQVNAYRENAAKMSDFDRTFETRQKTGVFTGGHVVNPINGDLVPVYVGDYVLISFGTGAVMGVPAHDERDFEFAKKFNLPVRAVLVPTEGEQSVKASVSEGELCWTDPGVMLPCRAAVARELGLEGISNKEAGEKITAWLEAKQLGNRVVNYKLRDWLFSRQRYWGEPIPIIHWEDGRVTALSDSELPLVLPQVSDYKPSESGESPLAKAPEWLEVTDPTTGKKGRRETNTMPQWAGSCWYYLRFIDPHNTETGWDRELEKKWMPVDLYVGGAEHAVLHLLYSRFWHKVLFDLGYVSTREPFKKLFNQGMIQSHAFKDSRGALVAVDLVVEDEAGNFRHKQTGESLERIIAKMSKSLKNVINPDDIIGSYGADTLRTYLMFMGPLEASKPWDSKAITGNQRFLRRLYSFVTGGKESGFRDIVADDVEDREIKKAVHKAVKKVGEDLEALHFNTPISTMMELLNFVADKQVSKRTLEAFTLILAPFAAHLAEELWERLGNAAPVARAAWPLYDAGLVVDDVVTVVIQIAGKKRATIDVAAAVGEEELKAAVIAAMAGTAYKVSDGDKFITVRNPQTKSPKLVNVITKTEAAAAS